MRWIVARSLRFRWLVIFAGAATLVFGFFTTRDAPLDVFPEFAPPIVEVQTLATEKKTMAPGECHGAG